MTGAGESDEVGVDRLRRRLYRPDATDEDLRRYLARRPAPPETPAPEAPAARATPRGPLGIRAAVVGVLVAAVAVAGIVAARPGEHIDRAHASSAVLTEDVGEGEVLRVRVDAVASPTAVTATVGGVAAPGQRFTGRGNAVVDLAVPREAADGGRMRVDVSAGGAAVAAWRALLVVHGDDRTSFALVAARGLSDGPSSAGAPAVFAYSGRPPTRIAIAAPSNRGWTLVVAMAGSLGDSR